MRNHHRSDNQVAKRLTILFFRGLYKLLEWTVILLVEVIGGLLKALLLIVGIRFAPEATGNIVVASRQRKQRKQIEALQKEIEELKKSS